MMLDWIWIGAYDARLGKTCPTTLGPRWISLPCDFRVYLVHQLMNELFVKGGEWGLIMRGGGFADNNPVS